MKIKAIILVWDKAESEPKATFFKSIKEAKKAYPKIGEVHNAQLWTFGRGCVKRKPTPIPLAWVPPTEPTEPTKKAAKKTSKKVN
ncbi:MAG: hypothetical protein AAF546_00205 [Verrucomicrobiota bacterium]